MAQIQAITRKDESSSFLKWVAPVLMAIACMLSASQAKAWNDASDDINTTMRPDRQGWLSLKAYDTAHTPITTTQDTPIATAVNP